ncbi:hypothetical protein [Nonomuraea basaltis]|uniref:hypothetical protein n=1 Tax=Nonomuraea basaltis TaxID=2495887 RepID=UPI00110C4283|nr:hypothetical protein [Nonomuraea basaltis]TMR88908.1 hypothetical protein EJK15_63635 [Nonomuraea basaltis]
MTDHTAGPAGDYWIRHDLACALSLGACELTYLQAGVELLIDHEYWLRRADFTDAFITIDDSVASARAFIDWQEAIAALTAGRLPCNGGERRMLLIARSIAGAIPVDLSDALTGLDRTNIALVAAAVLRAAGLQDQVIEPQPDIPSHHRGAQQR